MLRIPATLACLLLIFVAFFRDRRVTRELSKGLWIPVLWLMILSSKPVTQWLMIGGSDTVDAVESGSPIDRAVFSAMIGAAIVLLLAQRRNWRLIIAGNRWIAALMLFAAVSVLWSDNPLLAFKRWVRAAGTAIVVLTALTETDPGWASQTVIRRVSFLLVPLSPLLIRYYDIGVGWDDYGTRALLGVTNNKNTLGRVGMMATLYFLWLLLNSKEHEKDGRSFGLVLPAVYLGASVWILTAVNSATALVCASMGSVILLLYRFVGIQRLWARILVYVVIPLWVVFVLAGGSLGTYAGLVGRDATLTGRTDLWAELLEMGGNALVGTGYGSFWAGDRLRTLWERHWWKPMEAHNGFLEIYLELGLVGLAILLGVLVSAFRRVEQRLTATSGEAGLHFAVFVMFLFYNVTESATSLVAMMWFIFLLFSMGVVADRREMLRSTSRSAAGFGA